MGKYAFNTETTPKHLMPVYSKDAEKKGFITGHEFKQGLFLHGPQCGLTTQEVLDGVNGDSIAEFILTKEEFKNYIVEAGSDESKVKTKK